MKIGLSKGKQLSSKGGAEGLGNEAHLVEPRVNLVRKHLG